MPRAYRCRWCKGPPLPQPPEGACPNCLGFYRYEPCYVAEGDLDGATIPPIKQGEPISAADAIAHARARKEEGDRIETGLPGVDWVFNGGLPTKGTALFCSPAGTGKTTLAWELGRMLARKKIETLFLSSEQTIEELGAQFERLGAAPAKHFILVSETDQSAILRVIEKSRAQVVFLDSLHEVEGVTDEGGYDLASGGERAVTRIAKEIRRLADDCDFFAFLIGHMKNDGSMSGGAHLRHAVGATLLLEREGDPEGAGRILRFKEKNRFGPIGRKSRFQMTQTGLRDLGPVQQEVPIETPAGKGKAKKWLN